jgi:GNAT superfamily N-acetyltransferase
VFLLPGGIVRLQPVPAERIVRDAVEADAPSVAALIVELGYPADEALARERIAFFTADPGSRMLVAELSGETIGVIGLHRVPRLEDPRPALRITDLVVAGSHRGGGHGRALLDAAATEAAARSCSRIEVLSHNRREAAHAFYESQGYATPSRAFRLDLD